MLVIPNFLWGEIPLDPSNKKTQKTSDSHEPVTSQTPNGVFHRPGHLDIARLTINGSDAIPRLQCFGNIVLLPVPVKRNGYPGPKV